MERRITRTTRVVLEGVTPEARLDSPLFAINWFNTRSRRLYDLYNLAAASRVRGVGASVLFKGSLVETLAGSAEEGRQVLLIVRYPSGERFLDLLAGKLFQALSLLRILAVREFSFALNERVDGATPPEPDRLRFEPGRAWAIHHFASEADVGQDLAKLEALADSSAVSLRFASRKLAEVAIHPDGEARRALPSLTENVVLFEADTPDRLREALLSAPFQEFALTRSRSYMGLLDRVM
jgi:uncharacterized protein (DUF1330 family)